MGERASYREGAGFNAVSFTIVALIAVVGGVITARLYGIEVIGEYALATATVNAVRLLSSAKERPALMRELAVLSPRAPRVTGLVAATLIFSAALTATIGLIATVVIWFLFNGAVDQPDLFAPAAVSVLGYVVVANTADCLLPVLNSFRAGRALLWIRLHEALVFLALAVLFGIVDGSVWGLIAATIIAAFTAGIHRVVSSRRFMSFRLTREEFRAGMRTLPEMIRFGLKITPGELADGVSNESGTWALGVIGPVAAVGAWGRAYMMTKQVLVLNQRIVDMLFPTLIERQKGGDALGFSRALTDSLRYSAILLLAPAAAAGGAAYGVMALYGEGFGRAADALAIALVVPAIAAASKIQRWALFSVDRPWTSTISGLVRMVVTVAATIWFGSMWGPTGVAAALVLGYLADLAFLSRTLPQHLSVPLLSLWPLRELVVLPVAYAAAFGASRGVYEAIGDLIGLLAGIAVGFVVYALIFGALGAFNERDRARLREMVALAKTKMRGQESPEGEELASPESTFQ